MKSRCAALLLLFGTVLLMTPSCITRKDISYFQDISGDRSSQKVTQNYEAVMKPGDLIGVHVTSLSNEANNFFNSLDEETGRIMPNTYLIDADGSIEMPLIGRVEISGLTTHAARHLLRGRLDQYLVEPTVRIRIRNFKVTVLGEVLKPGVYEIPDEKITLAEALGLAGDLTIFARRHNLLLIREDEGIRKFIKIDLRSKDFFESDYYYLRSNDIIYVEPGKGKIASADAWYRILPIVFSGLTAFGVLWWRLSQ
jgi:polysaccharide export outer membrane protein